MMMIVLLNILLVLHYTVDLSFNGEFVLKAHGQALFSFQEFYSILFLFVHRYRTFIT